MADERLAFADEANGAGDVVRAVRPAGALAAGGHPSQPQQPGVPAGERRPYGGGHAGPRHGVLGQQVALRQQLLRDVGQRLAGTSGAGGARASQLAGRRLQELRVLPAVPQVRRARRLSRQADPTLAVTSSLFAHL